jgi:hypothetical protein
LIRDAMKSAKSRLEKSLVALILKIILSAHFPGIRIGCIASRGRRGGRSMGKVLWRGWGEEGSARRRVGSGSGRSGAAGAMPRVPLVVVTTVAGACGSPRPGAHDKPEQGQGPGGMAAWESEVLAGVSSRNHVGNDVRNDRRPASEVTP